MEKVRETGETEHERGISAEEWRGLIVALLPSITDLGHLECVYYFTRRMAEPQKERK